MSYNGMPVEDATDKQFNTLNSLKRAIDKLGEDKDLVIADYLLRVQIFEFNLKYLWQHYGFKNNEKVLSKDFDRWTLGETINVLEQHNDNYFANLIPVCREINKMRASVVHHLLDEETNYDKVTAEVIAQKALIDEVQNEIWHYLEWDKGFVRSNA